MKKNRRTVISISIRTCVTVLASIALAFALIGCTQPAPQPSEKPAEQPQTQAPEPEATPVQLQIFAANSLEKALPEVQALYTAAHPNVTFADTQFKGSGDLVTEIQGGAAPDILITASKGTMDTAEEGAFIDPASRRDMFGNDLVIAKGMGSNVQINALEDVAGDNITSIAIGDADAVPAGAYANQALSTIGLYSDDSGKGGSYDTAFESKVSIASSVGNAAKYVESGDCQIGFVYSSDIFRFSGIEVAYVIPTNTHKAILYPGAILKNSQNAATAADFLDFCLNDPGAQRIWSQYGFEVL
ncbi:MAG: molybdate ABC transporter substrate-binding protein [Coriobacteriia bacterium]|nr:molybdate ABC transporter substrate-binding protein [Coriobacteriia bacterium]